MADYYDVIIIGTGAGGGTLAWRLAPSGKRILLLERGYAGAPLWIVVVTCGFPAGLGAGAIDAGLNTYVATNHSPRTLNWIHACYGVGAASGPMIMTAVLSAGRPWQRGYAIVGIAQLLLAATFALTLPSWPGPQSGVSKAPAASARATLRQPVAWFGIAAFFVYTGLEAVVGVWAYTLLTESRGVERMTAGTWVSAYWASLTVGRVLVGFVANRIPVHRLLRSCIFGAVVAAAMIALDVGQAMTFTGLALSGLAFAPIFPTMIAATPSRLGEAHAANGIGFQIAAAAAGQSLLPWLVGAAATPFGLGVIGPAVLIAAVALFVIHEALVRASRSERVASIELATG